MATQKNHPFHIIDPSPWPFVGAIGALVMTIGIVLIMNDYGYTVLLLALPIILLTMAGWWYDVIKESEDKKTYTPPVMIGLQIGMALFIGSEVMFFVSFFWAFFNASLFPTEAMGDVCPPEGIHPLNPFTYPYLNTLILLLSGTTITWAHHSMLGNKMKDVQTGLALTFFLGFIFLGIQVYEYAHATFGFTQGIYPSTFYMATGFHGAHVLIGALFLVVCWFRSRLNQFTSQAHVGFEAATWYWHFVDVVWLFLFISIYWWGSGL